MMPSTAFDKFERYMLKDVKSLIKVHSQLNHSGGGRRGLGYITRSGILTLCAAWELYLEELIVESCTYLTDKIASPDSLPRDVKKKLAQYAKDHKNTLKVLELAGEGWKKCFLEHAKLEMSFLNTPKTEKVNKIFKSFIGFDSVSDNWTYTDIDDFIKLRGEIAHKGSQATYVNIHKLKNYVAHIEKTVLETDNITACHLRDVTPSGSMPWRRRTI